MGLDSMSILHLGKKGLSSLGVFNPIMLDGLQTWYRSDLGITIDTGVGVWADQSGGGHDLIQTVDASQPTIVANQINGHPIVRFDGINDFIKNPSNVILLVQPVTIFIVFKVRTLVIGKTILDGTATFSQNIQPTGATTLQMYSGAGGIYNADLVPGTFQLMTCIFNDGSSVIQMGNSAEVTGNTGTSNGQGLCLGGRPDAADFSEIDVAEVIMTNTIATNDERNNVKGYVSSRYGI